MARAIATTRSRARRRALAWTSLACLFALARRRDAPWIERDAMGVESPRELFLASHGALLALDVRTLRSREVHRGRGVYYGTFPGDAAGEVWVVSRSVDGGGRDALVRVDATGGGTTGEAALESTFTHDVVRRGRRVFVADTGGGRILELEYPSMRTRHVARLETREHVNTLAPADAERYGEHAVWAVLHNLGPSELALVDVRTGRELRPRLRRVGVKSHGCVPYDGKFVMLNSGEGQLILVDPERDDFEVLWEDDRQTFMKGLAIVDDVAYFGVSAFGNRKTRANPRKTSDVVAFDMVARHQLWRHTVKTRGLLNIISAPTVAEASTYAPVRWDDYSSTPTLYSNWIDLREKAEKATTDLLRTYKKVDTESLKRYVLSLPPDAFTADAQEQNARLSGREANMQKFKPGVNTMNLIFSDRTGKEVFEFPFYARFAAFIEPLLNELFTEQLGVQNPLSHVIRMQFAMMNPGSNILPHVDSGEWAINHHRFHIPLVVPSDRTQFVMMPRIDEEVIVPLVEGQPFEINNAVQHRVKNDASTARIHLLIDFAEKPIPRSHRHVLAPGDVCEYGSLTTGRCIA